MLKKTPRSGWQFLGTGGESVADHSFRTIMIAFVLARLDGSVDADKMLRLALVHDCAEARTGDLNYMNQKYVTADEGAAMRDMTAKLPFGDELAALAAEYREQRTPEAQLARDADNLDMLLQLKEQLDLGNPQAEDWIPSVRQRLTSTIATQLADAALAGNLANWWFDRSSEWWVNGGKR